MRVVVTGGGMAGLVLARALAQRGIEARVLEGAPATTVIPGPIMLPFQAYDALADVGVLDAARAAGRDVPPHRNGLPISVAVGRQLLIDLLRADLKIAYEHRVVDLVRGAEGRVVGVRAQTPAGPEEIPADLVVGADGTHSRVRALAGIPADVTLCDTAQLSFRSPVDLEESFHLDFLADGRQIMVLGWPGGTAGSWQIDRPEGGEAAALAPGFEAFRERFVALLPQAAEALTAVGPDDLRYRETHEVRCERWWVPGVALIGEALHAMNPEAGIGSGLGMGDALALAVAIAANPTDPDAACADYERWRRPAVAPYLAMGSQAVRVHTGRPERPEERWPPEG